MHNTSRIWAPTHNSWYQELKVIAPYDEKQYDRELQLQLGALFADFHAVPYGRTVRQLDVKVGSRPDFALIRKDYGEWYIVEVETAEDNLKHVKKQIDDFTNGNYNSRIEANYIYKGNKSLDKARLVKLTQDNPKVLVLVDDLNSEWFDALSTLNPTMCVIKIYKDGRGMQMFSISNDYPYIYEAESHCHFPVPMETLLLVQNPDVLFPLADLPTKKKSGICPRLVRALSSWAKADIPTNPSQPYRVTFRGQQSEWMKVEQDGTIYLQPLGAIVTPSTKSYILKRARGNHLILELV